MPEPEPPQGRVRIVRNGRVATVPAENLQAAEQQGWSVETERQRRVRETARDAGLGDMLQTGAESALSAGTLGVSDVALGEVLGDEYREERAIREEALPGASAVGTGVGIIAPALLTGGAGGVAAGGARAGAGAVAKGAVGTAARAVTAPARAAMALGRGAEGLAAKGLGRLGVTGESVAGNALLTGSKFAAAGAVEGAAFGAGQALSEAALAPGGDYEGLAESMLAGAKDGALMGALGGGAAGIGFGALGRAGTKIAQSGAGKKIAEKFRVPEMKTLAAENAVHALKPSKRAARELGSTGRIEKVGQKLLDDDIVRAGRSYEEMYEAAQAVNKRSGDAIADTMQRLDKEAGFFEGAAMVSRIEKKIAEKATSSLKSNRRLAARVEQEVKDVVDLARTDAMTHAELHQARRELDKKIKWGSLSEPEMSEELRQIRGIMEDELERSVEKEAKSRGLDGLATQYREAKDSFAASRWAEKQLAEKVEVDSFSNRALSLTDNIQGAAGLVAGLSTGSIGAGVLASGAMAVANKYLREHGRGIIADLANRAAKTDIKINESMRRFFRRTGEKAEAIRHTLPGETVEVDAALKKKASETRAQAFQRVAAQIQRSSPPAAMVLDAEAPETGKAARAVNKRALDFLRSKLPPQQPPNPFYEVPAPHPEQIAQFARYLSAVKNPMGVLKSLENGTLTSEEAEAIRTVYPGLYSKMQEAGTEWFSKRSGTLPYADRIQFGVLLQLPVDPSLDPAAMQVTQQIMTQAMQPSQAAPPASPPPVGGLADEYESVAQQLERQEATI